jgi:AcrR family transcriptional regulator
MAVAAQRKTAQERREAVLDAALDEFAARGLYGASTEAIAQAAGISQPYVFRLFGTKKELFKAVTARCVRQTLEVFPRAAEGKRGTDALAAIGEAYGELVAENPARLRGQMQAYAACDDPEICEVVRNGFGDLHAYAERVSGLSNAEVSVFFARGMLFNVVASMGLHEAGEPWADRLIAGCKEKPNA